MAPVIKRITIGILLVAFATAGVGYGVAVASRDHCMRDTSNRLVASHVKGFRYDGSVVGADAIPVTSRVMWPFVVDVYYSVPQDLHAAFGHDRYMALPWGHKRLSHEVDYSL